MAWPAWPLRPTRHRRPAAAGWRSATSARLPPKHQDGRHTRREQHAKPDQRAVFGRFVIRAEADLSIAGQGHPDEETEQSADAQDVEPTEIGDGSVRASKKSANCALNGIARATNPMVSPAETKKIWGMALSPNRSASHSSIRSSAAFASTAHADCAAQDPVQGRGMRIILSGQSSQSSSRRSSLMAG